VRHAGQSETTERQKVH